MIFSESIQEEYEKVFVELKDKILIEISLENKLDRLFDSITDAYSLVLSSKELKKKIIDIDALFGTQLESILEASYKQSIDTGIDYFRNDKIINSVVSKQEINFRANEVKQQMKVYAEQRKITQSATILQTTKDDFIRSQVKIEKLIRDNGLKLTKAEKNSLIMDNFNQRLNNRSSTIAVTETQNVLQKTKQLSANSVIKDFERQGKTTRKRWTSVLDGSTRPAHASAHGQLQPVDGLFLVDREQLEFPGDTAHGASVKNVVNCRCSYFMTVLS